MRKILKLFFQLLLIKSVTFVKYYLCKSIENAFVVFYFCRNLKSLAFNELIDGKQVFPVSLITPGGSGLNTYTVVLQLLPPLHLVCFIVFHQRLHEVFGP